MQSCTGKHGDSTWRNGFGGSLGRHALIMQQTGKDISCCDCMKEPASELQPVCLSFHYQDGLLVSDNREKPLQLNGPVVVELPKTEVVAF